MTSPLLAGSMELKLPSLCRASFLSQHYTTAPLDFGRGRFLSRAPLDTKTRELYTYKFTQGSETGGSTTHTGALRGTLRRAALPECAERTAACPPANALFPAAPPPRECLTPERCKRERALRHPRQ